MPEYVVLIPDHEAQWEAATAEHRASVYERHAEFARLLAERGHEITGGNELQPSRTAITVRTAADGTHTVTEGPYAESTEQLSGFYVVRTDDLTDLVEVVKVLGAAEGALEIRPVVDHSGS